MDQNEVFSIRVKVGEKYYPLKVKRADEEKVRQAAKRINDKIVYFTNKFGDKNNQDILAMASLQLVVEMSTENNNNIDLNPFLKEIKALDKLVNEYIEKT